MFFCPAKTELHLVTKELPFSASRHHAWTIQCCELAISCWLPLLLAVVRGVRQRWCVIGWLTLWNIRSNVTCCDKIRWDCDRECAHVLCLLWYLTNSVLSHAWLAIVKTNPAKQKAVTAPHKEKVLLHYSLECMITQWPAMHVRWCYFGLICWPM